MPVAPVSVSSMGTGGGAAPRRSGAGASAAAAFGAGAGTVGAPIAFWQGFGRRWRRHLRPGLALGRLVRRPPGGGGGGLLHEVSHAPGANRLPAELLGDLPDQLRVDLAGLADLGFPERGIHQGVHEPGHAGDIEIHGGRRVHRQHLLRVHARFREAVAEVAGGLEQRERPQLEAETQPLAQLDESRHVEQRVQGMRSHQDQGHRGLLLVDGMHEAQQPAGEFHVEAGDVEGDHQRLARGAPRAEDRAQGCRCATVEHGEQRLREVGRIAAAKVDRHEPDIRRHRRQGLAQECRLADARAARQHGQPARERGRLAQAHQGPRLERIGDEERALGERAHRKRSVH